ncbi:transmembrane protein 230-like [Dendrobium catenatum]|uniref:Transmembrane protein 230 n=1 Tax=Dendrobium catenatum TaxID=906689 RepID=A0A2I0WVY2_9ASPA|nr:transmembrane protein 230-like [Dendrobium catenatum]PKU79817.1 hypothetical protein MA16_Dca024390 [Dendrobium catenatum]
MAYVDHAFSISDEDVMIETSYSVSSRPPIKEIVFAVALLVFGSLSIIAGLIMATHQIGGDRVHGIFFAGLGSVLFLPGFYYTRIAYYAYKGYKDFSFDNIPPV